MRTSKSIFFAATMAAVVSGMALGGCMSNNSPTSPYGSGSMGGGGTTAFNSGTLNAPATFVRVFPTAGAVGYHCAFHVSMGMRGTVTVTSGGADSASVTAAGTSFTPASVSIRPGGFVRWNVTEGTHTVTSD